jgi:TRAP-type C4-dicarboxylate transport system permease small subunit
MSASRMAVSNLDRAYGAFKYLEKIGLLVSGASLMLTVLLITIDVFVRNFTSHSLVGIYEVVQNYLMPLMVFPAIPYAYSEGIMPRIVMVTDKLSARVRVAAAILISLIEVGIFAAMAYFTFGYSIDSVREKLGFICGTRMLPLYHMMFLPMFSFAMITIENVFLLFTNIKNKTDRFTYK